MLVRALRRFIRITSQIATILATSWRTLFLLAGGAVGGIFSYWIANMFATPTTARMFDALGLPIFFFYLIIVVGGIGAGISLFASWIGSVPNNRDR